MKSKLSTFLPILTAGAVTGLLAVLLAANGNPANMGFCIACFIRDIAGGLGLHRAAAVQYIRPEIPGLVLGAFFISLFRREFRAQSGSAPLTRFLLGGFVMIGSLVFLGCPLRMVLHLAGGDLNALVGLAGFVCGVGVGAVFLNKGFSLRRAYSQPRPAGHIPAVVAAQTAGHFPIDFSALGLSALCIPGHKGLPGPQGIGALLRSRQTFQI